MNDDSLSAEERRDKREKGLSVMRIGLGLQLICFALFAFVGARFLLVSRRWSDRAAAQTADMRCSDMSSQGENVKR